MGIPNAVIPSEWPKDFETSYNSENPQFVKLGNTQSLVFFSVSPPQFRPIGRDNDIDALIKVIDNSKDFVYVAVMDYAPTTLYGKPNNKYWPFIDDAFRRAAFERKVHVRLLMSRWNHTYTEFYSYLYSLQYMNTSLTKGGSIEVKLFNVPDYNIPIPYARVNHNKYMVTDNTAFITTSNWSGDYFIDTAGISMIIQGQDSTQNSQVVTNVRDVFLRDWNSKHSKSIFDYDVNGHEKHP
uniref:PLD phosphodiesterase domain-containing protein n=1 Tax=Panagrolaimus davidi TaxID=227884 RepID=A0A914PGY1_9BILA